jgi:hypothetical protein
MNDVKTSDIDATAMQYALNQWAALPPPAFPMTHATAHQPLLLVFQQLVELRESGLAGLAGEVPLTTKAAAPLATRSGGWQRTGETGLPTRCTTLGTGTEPSSGADTFSRCFRTIFTRWMRDTARYRCTATSLRSKSTSALPWSRATPSKHLLF